MRSVIRSRIAASPEFVFELVRDVRRWPGFLPHYRRVRPLRTRDRSLLAEYVALRRFGGTRLEVPVVWRSWSSADPATLELAFRHSGGLTDGMVVRWRLRQNGDGTTVEIEHVFERPLPLPGRVGAAVRDLVPDLVDRLVVRPIASRTLQALRLEAEGLTEATLRATRFGRSGAVREPRAPA